MITKTIFKIFPYLIIGALLYMMNITKSNYNQNKVSVKKDSVYTPVILDSIETKFDTIYLPSPVKDSIVYKENKVNIELLEKYKAASDKLALYEEAIEINKYEEVFEDSIQKVTVFTEARGKVTKQSIEAVVKERKAPCYTKTIETTIIKQDNKSFFIGGDVLLVDDKTKIVPSAVYKFNNHTMIKFGTDGQNYTIGAYINLW